MFLTIGTSAVVYPAAGLVDIAKSGGAVVVEVNPAATPYTSRVDYALAGSAADVLPGFA